MERHWSDLNDGELPYFDLVTVYGKRLWKRKKIYNKYASELSILDNGDFRNQDYKEIYTNNTCRRMS